MTRGAALFGLIAMRNVRRNARRSALTVAAIAFGLLCLVVFQALKVGLHEEMVRSTIELDAGSLQVHAAGYEPNIVDLATVPDPGRVVEALGARGETRVARRVRASALLLAGGRSAAVVLSGVRPEEEARVTFVARRVVGGAYLAEPGGILLGETLCRSLGVGPGATVGVMAQGAGGWPATAEFRVSGVFRTELESFDRAHAFLRLEDAQRLLGTGDGVTEIAVRAAPGEEGRLRAGLGAALPASRYQARTWQEVAPDVRQLIELNDATMRLLVLIVFAIIAMGIANIMTATVFERFREFGVLAAVGTTPAGILALVALESLLLGLLAAAVGTAAALAACSWLASHGVDLTRLTSANQYFASSHVLKARLLPADLAAANAVTVATALAGGLYPAWRASRLDPAAALTHF